MQQSMAIIGAGLSGLALAHTIGTEMDVTVFEKSAGVGGRMASRRAGGHEFDHGAQFFIARSRVFKRFLRHWLNLGVVAPWYPRVLTLVPDGRQYRRPWFEPHYVAVPGMTGLAKRLADGKQLRLGTGVTSVRQDERGWFLQTDNNPGAEQGPYDWLVLTAPAPQCAALLDTVPEAEGARSFLDPVFMDPCIAFLLRFSADPGMKWQVGESIDSFLCWAAANDSKPGRPGAVSWVVHATPEWSTVHGDSSDETLIDSALHELRRLTGSGLPQLIDCTVKHWRYARTTKIAEAPSYLDSETRLGLCGDWCVGSYVEAAYLSARDLARRLGFNDRADPGRGGENDA